MKHLDMVERINLLFRCRVQDNWITFVEHAKARRITVAVRNLLVTAIAFTAPLAFAAPTGGQVSSGAGTIAQAGANTTITQTSQNLAINWQTFSIGSNEAVHFSQPNASSIALNRVLGQDPSSILGSLTANGQVFVLNPNGVLFGTTAQVNVGGLVASTLRLSDADFMAGNYTFSNAGSSGSVINQGNLTAANGGYIAMLAPEVRNQGVITATLGTAMLAAGNKVTLNLNNGSLLSYSVDQGTLNALAENKQLIHADGGQVIMSAKAADALSTAVVNNTGIIEARTIQNHNGIITLAGDMQAGQVSVSGTLDASAPDGGNGGFIETSAAHVDVARDAKVTTLAPDGQSGTWLIDPVDFTIAASGGDMTGSTLSSNLGGGNVTILSSNGAAGTTGNVNVNDAVTWSANQLTLNAQNNININANLNGSGTASLALQYGQGAVAAGNNSTYNLSNGAQVNLPAGNNFSTKLGSDGVVKNFTVITALGIAGSTTAADLQGINGGLSGNYVLGANIDATGTSFWNTNSGFTPVGNSTTPFTGTFDGLGHTITNLTINRPTTAYVGLFGYTGTSSVIRNVGLVGSSVNGLVHVGNLVGYNYGTVNNSYAAGNVSGHQYVGGLAGFNNAGTISNSYSAGNVNGSTYVGGLVGYNHGEMLINSHYNIDAVAINGGAQVTPGGLYATQFNDWLAHGMALNIANYTSLAPVTANSFSINSVQGFKDMLGFADNPAYTFTLANNIDLSTAPGLYVPYLAGIFDGAGFTISNLDINQSFGSQLGLFGKLASVGAVRNVGLLNAAVSGYDQIGGLVGYNRDGAISNSYVIGEMSGASNVGGLVGNIFVGSVSNSYSSVNVSGISYIGGLVGYNSFGVITNSYTTGSVNGITNIGNISGVTSYIGGLVGVNALGTITNSYAVGSVSGTGSNIGGLLGANNGTITNGYWNIDTSGQATSAGGTGLTSTQMQNAANFAGFNFTTTPGATGNNWVMVDVNGTLNNVGGATGSTLPMLASEYSTSINNAHQLQLMEMALSAKLQYWRQC